MADLARCVIACDFTPHNLVSLLRRCGELPAQFEILSGDVRTSLLGIEGQLTPTDLVIVWTRPHTTPSEEVGELAELLARVADRVHALFAPTWALGPDDRGLGMMDWRAGGLARTVATMNLRLAERLEGESNAFLFDTQRWLLAAGDGGANPRGWYLGKIPYTTAVFREAAEDFVAAVRGLRGAARKLLVVDLDNTLWGGIVGEVGWEQLRIGGHDAVGEAFVDFQRELAKLERRGVVLGIVSKNDEQVALTAIDQHPEMVLRRGNFAGWRINWRDKAENLAELAADLNLATDAVVFIDDQAAERGRVREALPEVLVPDWPADPMLYSAALTRLRCFDKPSISDEDRRRSGNYVLERERRAARALSSSNEDWLSRLGIVIEIEPLSEANLVRAAQLLNKTNQMNLSTRRLGQAELQRWTQEPGQVVETFRLRDRFGDAGITGLLGVAVDGALLQVVDFVLSCRVFGRGAEQTMLHRAVQLARQHGATRVCADYVATARNGPCLEFFRDRSGFQLDDAGMRFTWDVERPFESPAYVDLRDARSSAGA